MTTWASVLSPTRLRTHALAAATAMAVQTLVGVVLYGYLVRRFGVEVVGIWVSLMAAGLLASMADFGLNHALVRQVAHASSGHRTAALPALVETVVTTVAVSTGAALLAVWLAFPWWSAWLSFAPSTQLEAAAWLPCLCAGLWLNRIADALAGALDGQLRFVERSVASSLAQTCGLVLTVACAPVWGMTAVAAVFVLQNFMLLCLNLKLLSLYLPGLCWFPPRWHKETLREAVRYGVQVQALVLCYMLLESAAKLALASVGNLAAVTYFDLAARIGKGVRGLMASALRVLVPRLAQAHAPTHTQTHAVATGRRAAYALSFDAVLVVAVTLFSALLASSQLVSWALLGAEHPMFVAALQCLLPAWLVYSLTDPAVNLALSTGRMRWLLLGHLATVVLGALCLLAVRGSATAVWSYASVALAMVLGCLITLLGIHRDEAILFNPRRVLWCLLVLAGVLAVALLGGSASVWLAGFDLVPRWLLVFVAYAGLLALFFRLHPAARAVVASY